MQLIAVGDVANVFGDEVIHKLARLARLPPGADLARFANSVRYAVRTYVHEARQPDDNALHREIEALERAARGSNYERVAKLLACMSERCREWLMRTAETPAFRAMGKGVAALPAAETMHDAAARDAGCRLLEMLCVRGGRIDKEGRWRRAPGRRWQSRTFRIELNAPRRKRGSEKRRAERELLFLLGIAYWTAAGHPPPRTAHPDRLGPFARLLAEVLRLAYQCRTGGGPVDIPELIKSCGHQFWPARR